MKRITSLLILLGLLLQINACGIIYSFDRNLVEQIDTWIANDDYVKALDALAYIRKTHAQYEELQHKKIEVEKAAKKFEQQQIKMAAAHIEHQEWDLAEKTLTYSMQKLPGNVALKAAHEDFVKKRTFYLNSLYYQLYINKAEWLVKNADVQNELARTLPDDRKTRRALEEHQQESADVYQQLTVCGVDAMNIGDLELAEQCFLLADELQPSQALQTTILDIQKQLASKQKRATVTISERGRTLLASAKRKMKDGNLKDAIDLYKQIPARDQKHDSVAAFKQELDARIQKNVTQGIELGRKLYSQGEIKQALAVWNDLRELDPKNQHLISYINRAERVLNKLEQLQKEDTTVKPPENKEPNS